MLLRGGPSLANAISASYIKYHRELLKIITAVFAETYGNLKKIDMAYTQKLKLYVK